MAGIFRGDISIYIVDADTDGSSLTDADKITGEISNWEIDGLEDTFDVKYLFGGDLEIERPRGQGTVSFDVSVSNTAASTLDRWDEFKFSSGTSTDAVAGKAIFIQASSNSLFKTIAINNAKVTTSPTTMSAEDELQKTVSFTFNAQTAAGAANLKTSSVAASTAFFTW